MRVAFISTHTCVCDRVITPSSTSVYMLAMLHALDRACSPTLLHTFTARLDCTKSLYEYTYLDLNSDLCMCCVFGYDNPAGRTPTSMAPKSKCKSLARGRSCMMNVDYEDIWSVCPTGSYTIE